MYKIEWKEFAIQIINNWFSIRKSMYFVLIKDILFCEKKQEIMIKYQCANKRIGDVIPLIEFMQSPLKHATHPDQMLYIGIQFEKLLNFLQKKPDTQTKIQTDIKRFKQVFYHNDQ